MIPKKIHYCWFGTNKKNDLILKCIESWKKYLPEYEIIEWNEKNFDINMNLYTKEAYQSKSWAFVTDYVRLYALYNHGGLYFDTDVEVFKDFNLFLSNDFFSGFELYDNKLSPITAVMGSMRNNEFIRLLLNEYENISFLNEKGEKNLLTNTRRISEHLYKVGFILEDKYQVIKNIHIYPSDYFCNKSHRSYAIHHFNGSWVPYRQKIRKWIRYNITNKLKGI